MPYLQILLPLVGAFAFRFIRGHIVSSDGSIHKGELCVHAILLVAGFLLATLIVSNLAREQYKNATYGILKSKNETLFSGIENKYPKIKLGFSNAFVEFQTPIYQQFLLWFTDSRLQIKVNEGRLLVDAKIRNSKGDMIGEIIDNEWSVRRPPAYDRNYTADALEVKDDKGDIVLQVKVTNDWVQLQAVLYGVTGDAVMIGSRAEQGVMKGQVYKARSDMPIFQIQPMFKYPSDKYFGKTIPEEVLPDGRKRVGVVVFEEPQKLLQEINLAVSDYQNMKYAFALVHAKRAAKYFEQTQKNIAFIPPEHVAGGLDKSMVSDLYALFDNSANKLKHSNSFLYFVTILFCKLVI